MTWSSIVVLGLLIVAIAVHVSMRIHARRAVGRRLTGIPGPLGNAIDAGGNVLAVFSSPSCGACRRQAPAVELLGREFPSVHSVNIAESPSLARAFGIMATPTTVLIRAGRVEAVLIGIQREKKLRGLLTGSIPT